MDYKECKNQKKIPEKGHGGTYFPYKNHFHTVSFHASKEQTFIFRKYTGLNFPAGCSNSLHQCHASAARRPTVHKMHIDLPFIHCHAQLLCKIIAAG